MEKQTKVDRALNIAEIFFSVVYLLGAIVLIIFAAFVDKDSTEFTLGVLHFGVAALSIISIDRTHTIKKYEDRLAILENELNALKNAELNITYNGEPLDVSVEVTTKIKKDSE